MERKQFLKQSATITAFTLVGASLVSDQLKAANILMPTQNLLTPKKLNPMDSRINYEDVSTVVGLRGNDVKVHGLCTGTVAVKTAFRTKRGPVPLAKLNILLDHHFTEYMPIWVWVIEHPEGTIIIDTGENSAVNDRSHYLAKESAYSRYISEHTSTFIVDEADALPNKLGKINVKPQDIRLIVLTHLHLDHTDGLRFFPYTEIIVNKYEFDHPYANLPTTYPTWFNPNKVTYQSERIDVFDCAYPITSAGDLLYVPTPGHTHGHSSVIFKTDDFDIIFAGDTSYNQEQVLNNELAGVNVDFKKSEQTYKNLMAYAKHTNSLYLPTHDGNSGRRLQNKSFLVNA